MRDWALWGLLLAVFAIVDVALAATVTIHAVLWKRDSRAVIGWVGLAWLGPIWGSCAYYCLGINRIRRKARLLKFRALGQTPPMLDLSPQELDQVQRTQSEFPNLVGLAAAGKQLTGLSLTPGNQVEPLVDGDQAYPAMIEAIDAAQHSVALLSYIFDSDRAGERFLTALTNARERGVEVRVLIDDVGSKYSRPNMVPRLQERGIAAASFLPTRIPRLPTTTNMRNHRKILIVDGEIGFTGGTNIREDHWRALQPQHPVQCLHFKLQGPVVGQLQNVFALDWAFAVGEAIHGERWFPSNRRSGTIFARAIEHGPDENFEKLVDVLASALACARTQVRIVTPYFLPRASLIEALNVAALRGVAVEIYLPSANNVALVHWAATAQLWQVLQKGCRVFYTPPPFDHTKLMIVDGAWTLVGSTNWDPRSLRLNFECNVECYSTELAGKLNQIVDQKAETAREVTLAEVDSRSYPIRLRDGLARLLSPYL